MHRKDLYNTLICLATRSTFSSSFWMPYSFSSSPTCVVVWLLSLLVPVRILIDKKAIIYETNELGGGGGGEQ